MIYKAVLVSRQYDSITLPFPIPNNEYDHAIELLEGFGMGDAQKQDCQVIQLLENECPVLKNLVGTEINVDELDYLAKRLESFCENEDEQFQAMAHKLDLTNIKDFINLTFCCQDVTVISDFSKLEQAGKYHAMNQNGGSMSMDDYQKMDGQAEALKLIQNETGSVTPYGVVYDNGMKMEEVYNGRQFPAYFYDSCLLVLGIRLPSPDGESPDFEYLYLPASDQQIKRTLLRIGAESWEDVESWTELDELPEAVSNVLNIDKENIYALNEMCRSIQTLEKDYQSKLGAVVLTVQPKSAAQICQLAANLDLFDFAPDVHTTEEYGRYMIRESGRFYFDEDLEDFYDYSGYGAQRIEMEGGQFNASGYVAYHGTVPLEELIMEEQAEQEFQMGGLS